MPPLRSRLFAGDDLLQRIADDVGRARISRSQNKTVPSVAKVQQALLLWRPGCLPKHGADGDYGSETAGVVHRFKVDELHVPEAEVIDDVGPKTVQRLDEIALAAEAAATAPVVSSVSPATGPASGGTLVVITGQNFDGVTSVSFGPGIAASFSVDSPTQISAETAPVQLSGDVNVVVVTAGGASQPGPGSTFTFTAPVSGCTVTAFNAPVARSGCRNNAGRADEFFRMEADFAAPCNCCEFRQFIRGSHIVNGTRINHLLPDPAGGPPRPMLPRPPAGSANDNFLEDGLSPPQAGMNVFYGHRSETITTDATDQYLPDRPNGCQYRGNDSPFVSGPIGATFTLDLDFRGQIIDTCNGNAVKETREWTVTCNGTF
ncbi:MAG TPA: IPT/TIG domain-containing protein [Thermoleophilaceae bacterium]|jgi:hypothetical protein